MSFRKDPDGRLIVEGEQKVVLVECRAVARRSSLDLSSADNYTFTRQPSPHTPHPEQAELPEAIPED